jgi:hypothetical protein
MRNCIASPEQCCWPKISKKKAAHSCYGLINVAQNQQGGNRWSFAPPSPLPALVVTEGFDTGYLRDARSKGAAYQASVEARIELLALSMIPLGQPEYARDESLHQ